MGTFFRPSEEARIPELAQKHNVTVTSQPNYEYLVEGHPRDVARFFRELMPPNYEYLVEGHPRDVARFFRELSGKPRAT